VHLHKLRGLDEHATRAAARVVHPAVERLEHLDQRPHYRAGRVERAGILAGLLPGELAEEVLVHAPEDVVATVVVGLSEPDRPDQVDQLSEPALVEPFAAVVAGEHAADDRVLLLDEVHCGVDVLADAGELRAGLDGVPPGVCRDPEDVVSGVLVAVLDEPRAARLGDAIGGELGLDREAALGEPVGDVLQKHQTKHHVLVLARLLVAAQRVGGVPQLLLQRLRRLGCGLARATRHE